MQTTTENSRERQTRREIRQIARCKCGVTKSRLVTRCSRTVYGRDMMKVVSRSVRYEGAHDASCDCGRRLSFLDVRGTTRSDHPCDAKCLASKGHVCECACGGRNHGAAHG